MDLSPFTYSSYNGTKRHEDPILMVDDSMEDIPIVESQSTLPSIMIDDDAILTQPSRHNSPSPTPVTLLKWDLSNNGPSSVVNSSSFLPPPSSVDAPFFSPLPMPQLPTHPSVIPNFGAQSSLAPSERSSSFNAHMASKTAFWRIILDSTAGEKPFGCLFFGNEAIFRNSGVLATLKLQFAFGTTYLDESKIPDDVTYGRLPYYQESLSLERAFPHILKTLHMCLSTGQNVLIIGSPDTASSVTCLLLYLMYQCRVNLAWAYEFLKYRGVLTPLLPFEFSALSQFEYKCITGVPPTSSIKPSSMEPKPNRDLGNFGPVYAASTVFAPSTMELDPTTTEIDMFLAFCREVRTSHAQNTQNTQNTRISTSVAGLTLPDYYSIGFKENQAILEGTAAQISRPTKSALSPGTSSSLSIASGIKLAPRRATTTNSKKGPITAKRDLILRIKLGNSTVSPPLHVASSNHSKHREKGGYNAIPEHGLLEPLANQGNGTLQKSSSPVLQPPSAALNTPKSTQINHTKHSPSLSIAHGDENTAEQTSTTHPHTHNVASQTSSLHFLFVN